MDQTDHSTFMKRCITLARRGQGHVKTNPLVGSVVVYQGEIISEGWHEKYGGHHGERNALLKVPKAKEKLLAESTLYITLEPCNHHGKTPPCTDIIIQKNIKHVVIGQLDPNPLMMGKSVEFLRKKGVKVECGLLEKELKSLNRKFIVNQNSQIPYVIVKYAQSKDGYMGQREEQVWLSNAETKRAVHKWRSEIDAILVGTQTAIMDNPQLNTRMYPGSSPLRVVIDRFEKIPKSHHLISDSIPTLIYTSHPNYVITNPTVTPIVYPEVETDQLEWLLKDLYNRGIGTLMIEGGQKLLKSIISQQLWHEARIIDTDIVLKNGIKAPPIAGVKENSYSLSTDTINFVRSFELDKMLFG